jgi:exodeoxyribonuclease V gamma subunit
MTTDDTARMLEIRFSNRFDSLLDTLLRAMAVPPDSPFAGEEIIVPSLAIRRRIELAAADRFGICANVRFSFLGHWLWRQIAHVVANVGETSPFTATVLTWRVLTIFADKSLVAAHPRLAAYLRKADDVMRYELAVRVAALLEQYLTYRPDWLALWLDGKRAGIMDFNAAQKEDERWQGALWQRIAQDLGTDRRHPSVVFFEAMRALGPEAQVRAGLPAKAHIFCLPTTPPLYLDILRRLGQWIDLTLYVPNPCREYWFEIVDPRRFRYLAAAGRATHHEIGNRLLASWGKSTQAHIDLLLEDDGAMVVDDADFVPSEGSTLLGRLQNAILDLVDPAPGSVTLAVDRSIEVHVCHSLTRELEVLQDQLLMVFAGPRPPRPSDILVVMPDLEAAAPLIDAVFGNAPKARAIPYAITGRPAALRNPCALALSAVLAVATSRFQASAVFELLQQPIVARRFGVDAVALETLHEWMLDAGIRWGLDGRQRAEFDLPQVDRYSFSDGLDRLYLGYALPTDATAPLNERIAAGNAEGSAALALGSFREFVDHLRHLHDDLAKPKTPAQWRQTLLDILAAFVLPMDQEIDDLRETEATIRELHDDMAQGGMSAPLGVDVLRVALGALLDDPTRGGVPTGAVTFAAMGSLRHLPYRGVCVLGLNDGAFPSALRPSEFDLMVHAPRRGDRQRRIDERNVFLDLLLAARERLYLSYVGRSIRDNAPLPPSVLVAELLDYLVAAIAKPPQSAASLLAARERLVVEHPLQPFSPDNFLTNADPRRRSFNEEYCDALKQQPTAPAAAPAPQSLTGNEAGAYDDDADEEERPWEPQDGFFRHDLAEVGPEFREVTLDRLIGFFRNPCRYLLRERLGIALPQGGEELQDDEPFVPDWSARSDLAQRVLPRLLRGESFLAVRAFAHAGIEYPAGRLGNAELDRELARLGEFAHELVPVLREPLLEPVSAAVDFTIEGMPWQIIGGFSDLRPAGRIAYRYDEARAIDYLQGWIEHLFLCATAPPAAAMHTMWYSRDGQYALPRVANAQRQLAVLLGLYREGLQHPLHFFPKSAWRYMIEDHSLAAARSTWRSTSFRPYGEDRDPAYHLALRGVDDPLDAAFEQCAATVFAPLILTIHDERLKSHGPGDQGGVPAGDDTRGARVPR